MNFGSQFSSWSRLQTTFFLLADRRSSRWLLSFFASRRLWSCGPRHQARSAPAGGQRPRCGGSARFRRLPLPCAGDPRSVCVRRYAARGHPADFHAPADGRFGAIKPPTLLMYVHVFRRNIQSDTGTYAHLEECICACL